LKKNAKEKNCYVLCGKHPTGSSKHKNYKGRKKLRNKRKQIETLT
jgi:hypothetical protein